MSICYYHGEYMPLDECRLPVTDLAVQRGIGCFESVRTYGDRIFAMKEHLERLAESVRKCRIEAGPILPQLPDIIRTGLRRMDSPSCDRLIKPYITGGPVNDRGRFPQPDFFVTFENAHVLTKEEISSGVALAPNHVGRPCPEAKSTNYLLGYLPLAGTDESVFEALYIENGEVTESTASSFFLCREGKIITAPVGRVLRGITREIILTLAREAGFRIEERCPLESELADAQEAFVTGCVKEVLPVVRVGRYTIGNGKPGPVSQRIRHLFIANRERWFDKQA